VSPPRARKRFGQHFLVDPHVIDQIVALISPGEREHLVEIGPGRGALTAPLLATGARLSVIEIDRDLAAFVRAEFGHQPNLEVHLADALDVDFATLEGDAPMRVVGNLPYNISTPLILNLVEQACIRDLTFMLQKEVVDRLTAAPGSKHYGRLSVMVQSRARVESFFEVTPMAFEPPPKVTSKLVRITPQRNGLSPRCKRELESCVRIAFEQRRKILKNTLGKQFNHGVLHRCGISLENRPEDITVDAYVRLAKSLSGD
jgi:16S rRNA (adenine1518-N6/adenine1519-N6)-dimethyltransferase